jgi:hypothetical protein
VKMHGATCCDWEIIARPEQRVSRYRSERRGEYESSCQMMGMKRALGANWTPFVECVTARYLQNTAMHKHGEVVRLVGARFCDLGCSLSLLDENCNERYRSALERLDA